MLSFLCTIKQVLLSIVVTVSLILSFLRITVNFREFGKIICCGLFMYLHENTYYIVSLYFE